MKMLIGPFTQLLPLTGMSLKGALRDDDLRLISDGGLITSGGKIVAVDTFERLRKAHPDAKVDEVTSARVLLPGFIDCHTHLCFAGSRAKDYALRNAGKTYLEIAESGGGIWDSVKQTRAATEDLLVTDITHRVQRHFAEGVTTIEVKSGYGLSIAQELKQLRAIKRAAALVPAALIPTCLAAHLVPKDFDGPAAAWLEMLIHELFPVILREQLTTRADIFIERGAFSEDSARPFLQAAKQLGFDITVHADQFTTGGSRVAVELGAVSADHLEASTAQEITVLAGSATVAVVLPGASLGLGMPFAPARKLLDAGACVAIASDWNPGSAPMGDLLLQAAVIGAAEKLRAAEVFAGLTVRAAAALGLADRGELAPGKLADLQAFDCNDYREILYQQGKMKAAAVWKNGVRLYPVN